MLLRQQPLGDQRKGNRYEHRSKVIVENLDAGPALSGTLKNYGAGGFYFESDTLIRYGSTILIGVYDSPFSDTPRTYECLRVRIKWLKEYHGKNHRYGYGVEHLDIVTQKPNPNPKDTKPVLIGKSELPPPHKRRKHPRKSLRKPVYFVCNQKSYRGVTKDISNGGLFISTKDRLEVDQSMYVGIPNTKFDHDRWLSAKIVRVEEDGVAAAIHGILKKNR